MGLQHVPKLFGKDVVSWKVKNFTQPKKKYEKLIMVGKFKCVGALNLIEELNILHTRSLMASNLIQCE